MENLQLDIFRAFAKDWALVTAGSPSDFNTMTISWGGLGTLWGKSVATVYVKPIRYTHDYLEAGDTFTVSFFPEKYRQDLMLLGTESGRDGDKVAKTHLTPVPVENTVGFAEASVTLLCKKIYRQELDIGAMPPEVIQMAYTDEAAHTMYIGEVLRILR